MYGSVTCVGQFCLYTAVLPVLDSVTCTRQCYLRRTVLPVYSSVTCVGWGTVAAVAVNSIHTGALVPTGAGCTLVYVDLTVDSWRGRVKRVTFYSESRRAAERCTQNSGGPPT